MPDGAELEDLLRDSAPRVLAALLRRHDQLDDCEDATQEAMVTAATRWPIDGVPNDPTAWLVTTAYRRLVDQWRKEDARAARELKLAGLHPRDALLGPAADEVPAEATADDILTLLDLCCHPSLTPGSQIALTLRAVGGLTTSQIARAYLIPEATMAQRISRAKSTIKKSGGRFARPADHAEVQERAAAVRHVLYLMFNEGYTTTAGETLGNAALAHEAIRITRLLHETTPEDREVTALLALMLLTESRRAARTTTDGTFVPLPEQDRNLWDTNMIREGVALVTAALDGVEPGPYGLQAAIAAVHADAPSTEATDWMQVLILYKLLEQVAPNPVTTLNRAVATAMAHGPAAGLKLLDRLEETVLADHPRTYAVRAHLLEMAGDAAGARAAFLAATHESLSIPERRYLHAKAARLMDSPVGPWVEPGPTSVG